MLLWATHILNNVLKYLNQSWQCRTRHLEYGYMSAMYSKQAYNLFTFHAKQTFMLQTWCKTSLQHNLITIREMTHKRPSRIHLLTSRVYFFRSKLFIQRFKFISISCDQLCFLGFQLWVVLNVDVSIDDWCRKWHIHMTFIKRNGASLTIWQTIWCKSSCKPQLAKK